MSDFIVELICTFSELHCQSLISRGKSKSKLLFLITMRLASIFAMSKTSLIDANPKIYPE
ncbi:MAG: hypothetical protein PHD53_03245 [Methylococcales bacterium]|nr:hypothetical protein [Methylococcales bacterium]